MKGCPANGGGACLRQCGVGKVICQAQRELMSKRGFLADAKGHPILMSPKDIGDFVEQDCGAEGFTIHKGRLIALRWRDGVAFPVKTYDIDVRPG